MTDLDFVNRLTIDAACTRGTTPAERQEIFTARHSRPNKKDSPDIADDPSLFRWRVTLRLDGREHTTNFYIGCANIQWGRIPHLETGSGSAGLAREYKAKGKDPSSLLNGRITVAALEALTHYTEPEPPTARDVLYCLVSDALSWENARTFEDFAGEFGYSPDSRRAEKIYNACGETSKALRFFLPSGVDLSDLLEALDA